MVVKAQKRHVVQSVEDAKPLGANIGNLCSNSGD
jgi:hypothetical protein